MTAQVATANYTLGFGEEDVTLTWEQGGEEAVLRFENAKALHEHFAYMADASEDLVVFSAVAKEKGIHFGEFMAKLSTFTEGKSVDELTTLSALDNVTMRERFLEWTLKQFEEEKEAAPTEAPSDETTH